MKILRILLVVAFASAAPARAQQGGSILLSAVSGSVEIQEGPDQAWKAASAGAEMREGFSLRTGPDGRAQVTFPDKAVVWLKESSTFGLQSTLPLTRKVQLLMGELKASIPHLIRKQTFEVHTQNAVAAVRGTEFSVHVDATGALDIRVAFGEVKVHLLAEAKTYSVPQGNSFRQEEGVETKVSLMNKDQEKEILLDWSPGLSRDERSSAMIQKEESRASVRDFARQTDAQQQAIANLVQQTKDADFSAGRTLLDVHGNLTRVDQRLLRPTADSLQFVNLVKRPDYNYVDHFAAQRKWSNTQWHVTDRLDSMQAFVSFNEKLPQDLVEWPSFFKGHGSIAMTHADVVMANQTDPTNILVLGSFSDNCKYAPASPACIRAVADGKVTAGEDTLASDFYVGTVTSLADIRDTTKLLRAVEVTGAQGGNDYTATGEADGTLYAFHATPYMVGSDYFWLTTESYVIDNGGKVQNVDNFAKSGKDPFALLKETAGEFIFALKATPLNAAPSNTLGPLFGGDFVRDGINATGKNIDLVIVPDLAVTIVQKLASSLSEANN